MAVVHVAVAVIKNQQGQVLIQQRKADTHQGGLWEFPGGKLEADEAVGAALQREIDEELGLEISSYRPLIQIRHDYGDRHVLLDVFEITGWQGRAKARESQPIKWVSPQDLHSYDMPAADIPIVTAIQLPPVYVITPPLIDNPDDFLQAFEAELDAGERLFLYRVLSLSGMTHDELLKAMLQRCKAHDARLIIHALTDTAIEAHGLHLPESLLLTHELRSTKPGQLYSASCHSIDALEKAKQHGVDFVLLSPVQATSSHPEQKPLGWTAFAQMVRSSTLPVFALGGMDSTHLDQAWSSGAQGVAGISGWWSK